MGLKGDLSISEGMESLTASLDAGRVPSPWASLAWPSLRPLASWLINLSDRYKQLQEWSVDTVTPKVTWISGLFNPQAFLTAVMQVTGMRSYKQATATIYSNVEQASMGDGLPVPDSRGAQLLQVTARKNEWPLDKLVTVVDVTKKAPEDIETATREGAYIHGLVLDGARWDISGGVLDEAQVPFP